jgi:hypothetical protein
MRPRIRTWHGCGCGSGASSTAGSRLRWGERADGPLLEALTLAFAGALLQAGMGLMSYDEMGARLDAVVATIMEGHA